MPFLEVSVGTEGWVGVLVIVVLVLAAIYLIRRM